MVKRIVEVEHTVYAVYRICRYSTSQSFCCVQAPEEGLSFEDEVVLDYYDDLVNSYVYPKPVLSIPG